MELKDNQYNIQGIPALTLIEKHGAPLYVYNAAKIEQQYQKLAGAFKGVNLKILYACKALTNINILKVLRKLGAGLDTVSLQEVHLGLKAGYAPEQIMFTPNCVSLKEYEEAVKLGIHINIDNISILEQFGHKYQNKVPVTVRINPHIMAGGNKKISTGHIDSKFGISIYQLPHVKRVIATNNMNVEGLHIHTGSDILDVDVFLKAVDVLLNVAKDFTDLKFIDFGSGFKVPYNQTDISTDIELLGEKLSKKFKEFCDSYGRKLQLSFEPGKYLVSEAGYFMAKVNVIKQTTATVFAGLDTGLNHLIRPMFYDAHHEIINLSNPNGNTRIYTVVGYICETDTFGWNRKITEAKEGDIFCFKNAGAYCFSMASNYNSRYRPAEVMVHNGKDFLIRQRETMDDLLKNQVEIDF